MGSCASAREDVREIVRPLPPFHRSTLPHLDPSSTTSFHLITSLRRTLLTFRLPEVLLGAGQGHYRWQERREYFSSTLSRAKTLARTMNFQC